MTVSRTISIEYAIFDAIANYAEQHTGGNISKAIAELVEKGLKEDERK